MNVLIIDTDSMGLDLAFRAASEGHTVKLWQPVGVDKKYPKDGTGFPGVERVTSWQGHMAWAKKGLIINLFNDRKVTAALDKARAQGYPVWGPSVAAAELEWERGKGMKLFEKHGLYVPEYHTLPSLEAALKFAWKAQDPFVFKTLGDEEDKSLSFVPHDPAELVGWLQNKIANGTKMKGSCMLQEKVKILCECGISSYMGTHGFLRAFNLNFEHKKLMNGDNGPNTGETGTVQAYLSNVDDSYLVSVLREFSNDLLEMGHIGDCDIGGAITEKGDFVPFEWSNRCGWPAFFIQTQCHDTAVDWMKTSLEGQDTLGIDRSVACGVILTQPPFPNKNDNPDSCVGNIISGLDEVWDTVSPVGIMLVDGPVMKDGKVVMGDTYRTTAEYVACVTGKGHDVHDAVANCYAAVDKIKFPNKMVRTDIGARLEKELPKVKAFGYTEFPDW